MKPSPAFALAAGVFVVTMIGTTLPTPLYPTYEQRFHIAPVLIPVIFAVYAAAVLAGLLVFGRLSDDAGRKPVLFAGLALSELSAAVFLTAHSIAPLFAGRVLSGLSAGIFTGTATAALVELAGDGERKTATMLAVAANTLGLGCGTLLCGLLAATFAHPLRLPYAVDLALDALACVAMAFVPETVVRRGGIALRVQRLSIPGDIRDVFIPAAIAGMCAFAVSGLFSAIVPSFLSTVLHLRSPALPGVMVFTLFAATAAGQAAIARLPQHRALEIACALLAFGTLVLGAAVALGSWPLMFAAATIDGAGQGVAMGFGLAQINARVRERRGEVSSAYFVMLYIALAIPVVGVGVLAHVTNLVTASLAFSAVVVLIVATVFVRVFKSMRA